MKTIRRNLKMKNVKQLVLGSMLLLPLSAFASNPGFVYWNMEVYNTITNNTPYTIQCTLSSGTDWVAKTANFGTINSSQSEIADAGYNQDGTDTVQGTIQCSFYSNNYPEFITNLNFSHKCTSSLNESGNGSCLFSDYSNSASATNNTGGAEWSVTQTVGASGTNPSSLSVDYVLNEI